jgi:hypothetical protein
VTFQLYLPTPNNRTKLPIRFCHLQTILHTIPTKEYNARFQLSYGTTDILLPQKNKTSVRIRAAVKPNLLFSDGPGAWPSEEPLLQWQQPTHSNSPIISNSTGHSPPEISRIRIAPPAPPKHRNSRLAPKRETSDVTSSLAGNRVTRAEWDLGRDLCPPHRWGWIGAAMIFFVS